MAWNRPNQCPTVWPRVVVEHMYLDFLVPGPNSLLGLSWRPDNRVRTQRSKNPSAMEVSYRRSGRYAPRRSWWLPSSYAFQWKTYK